MKPEQSKETRNLCLFFLIAFAWSWIFWLPEILWGFRLYIAPFGPTVAAFVLTYINEKQSGIKNLLKKGLNLGFKKIWIIPIFLLMPTVVGLSLLLAVLTGEPMPTIPILNQPWIIIPVFLYILFLGGPIAEEFGWRGYALDRLQARYSAFISSVLLGIIWGIWHLPLFFMKEQEIYRNVPIWGFIFGSILLSILFTWIYNNTNKSILAVLLFHTTGNMAHFLFPAMATKWGGLYSVIINVIAVIIILIIWGPKKMVREKFNKSLLN